jgi:hypothetical protein
MTDDQMTFERQLIAAFAAYADRAPTDVDMRAVAEGARRTAASPAPSRMPVIIGGGHRWQLLAAAALLMLAVVGGAAVLVGSSPPDLFRTTRADPTVAPRRDYEGVFVVAGPIGTSSEAGNSLATSNLVRLSDGRVLMIGDSWPDHRQQTLWDPLTAQATPAGLSLGKREQPIGVLLEDGQVLIIGGDITEPEYVDGGYQGAATYSTAEIYDPVTGAFTAAGPMVGKGWAPSATRLDDGRVLVLDGISVDDAEAPDPLLATAEIYDPAADTFTATGPMSIGRGSAAMALLPDGRVLVLGGAFPETGVAELFDPAAGRFTLTSPLPSAGPHPDGGEYWPETVAAAVALPDGRILVPGRRCMELQSIMEGRFPTVSAIYDPATETFTAASPMPHCVETATALPDGRVFLTAFWGDINWSGIYDPLADTVTETAPPPAGRYMDVVGLADGRVLVVANGVASIFQ